MVGITIFWWTAPLIFFDPSNSPNVATSLTTANKLSTSVHYIPSATQLMEISMQTNPRKWKKKAHMKCTSATSSSCHQILPSLPLQPPGWGLSLAHPSSWPWFLPWAASIIRIRHLLFESFIATNYVIGISGPWTVCLCPPYTLEF